MLNKFGTFISGLALIATAPAVVAQQVPMPPLIKIVVPFAAGASTDIAARAIASQLSTRLGTSVIVENKAGGSTFIGVSAVAKGPKDGSMLLMTSSSTVSTAATKRSVPVDITTELLPVSLFSEGPLIVAASAMTDIKTPADLVAAARARPDMITHGTGGVGTLSHIAAELLDDAAKIKLKHVPYTGAALAVPDFVAGRIDLMFGVRQTIAAQVKAGKARLIGVTSAQPHPAFPGVPTMASVAPGYAIDIWVGFFAPVGTPPALIQRFNRELNEIAKSKEMLQIIEPDGSAPRALTPEEFGAQVRNSYVSWKKLAADKNIIAE